jgi:peptidoglycan/LPS O-acetylase OafA/YrhL
MSYSLYFVHPVVMLAVAHTVNGRAPLIAVVAMVPIPSILVAFLAQRLVEVPAMSLGRWASAVLSRKVSY